MTIENEKKNVAFFSVIAAVFLTGSKLLIGITTGSLGILSEALHSALDLLASIITYFSVRISDKPADHDHNYGHGKVENFSALVQTVLLVITSVWIIYEAVSRLMTGNNHIEVSVWSYIVVVSSIAIDFWRSRALSRVAKKYNSQALEADALHFSTDIWSSAVVGLGLVCAQFGWYFADSIAALGVAAIVLVVSYQLGKKATDVLIDRAPLKTIEAVMTALDGFPEIKHYHSLKVRTAGAQTFVKVNVHMDPNFTLLRAHTLCDEIEAEICTKIDNCEVDIHPEPQTSKHIAMEGNLNS